MIIDSDFVYLPACGNRGLMCGYCDDMGHMQLVAQGGLHKNVLFILYHHAPKHYTTHNPANHDHLTCSHSPGSYPINSIIPF